jgi:predicted amidophosphoribosyltransferase
LRRWKQRRGFLFDRQILKSDPLFLKSLLTIRPQIVVPIPQNFRRQWALGGSPAERISRWIAKMTALPLTHALLPAESFRSRPLERKRQAQSSMVERLTNPIRFRIHPESKTRGIPKGVQRAILVDDFITSGRTIAQASVVLAAAGIREIHAFCLGIRIPLHHSQ